MCCHLETVGLDIMKLLQECQSVYETDVIQKARDFDIAAAAVRALVASIEKDKVTTICVLLLHNTITLAHTHKYM